MNWLTGIMYSHLCCSKDEDKLECRYRLFLTTHRNQSRPPTLESMHKVMIKLRSDVDHYSDCDACVAVTGTLGPTSMIHNS